MNKRKASADRNIRRKAPSRRQSVSSLGKPAPTAPKLENSPSTQNFSNLEVKASLKAVQVNKGVETCIPKTRFTSQDKYKELRTSPSPRLKYFPMEKVRKLESPPYSSMAALIMQKNPKDAGALYQAADQCLNNGQGDATAPCLQQQRHQIMQSQQQVAHQIHQPNSNPEVTQQVCSNQIHPVLPHGLTNYSALRDTMNPPSVLQNPSQTIATQLQFAQHAQSVPGLGPDQPRAKPEEPVTGPECPDSEKQPIGGRNSALYRKLMMNNHQSQPGPQFMEASSSNIPNNSHQPPLHLQNHYSTPMVNAHPQQLYRQMQQNLAQQQQMQQRAINYQMQMMNSHQQPPGPQMYNYNAQFGGYPAGQAMTSPQDATVNRMKNSRMVASLQSMPVHQRDLDYSMNPQNSWSRNQVAAHSNAKAQLKPFTIDVVNNRSQPHFDTQNVHLNPQQQFAAQFQQRPMQQQLYRNPGQGMMAQSVQNVSAYNQQNLNQRPTTQSNPHLATNPQNGQTGRKKLLQFTSGMVKDQERLVSTMRQQGIPMDVMKRQFESLLSEQRRQLEYLEEMKKQDEVPEEKEPVAPGRRRKQMDEKPEWMLHLTPPRLSYLELERLSEQRKKERQNRQLEGQRQMATQQVENQPWQHTHSPQGYNNVYVQPYRPPAGTNISQANKMSSGTPGINNHHHQPQQGVQYYQYMQPPHQQHYNQQPHHYQQVYQEQGQHQGHLPEPQEAKTSSDPSSLLQMRLYREVIKPQKRNNGLQDPRIVRRELEELKNSAEHRRGFEYLARLTPKKAVLKLNGTQDRSEMDTELQHRLITSTCQPPPRAVSANGLENSRNPDNPPTMRLTNLKRMEQEFLREYPRQKQYNPRNFYNVQAERENGSIAVEQGFVPQQHPQAPNVIPYNDKNPLTARSNVMPFRFDAPYPQHYQQMQQYYQNNRNFERNNGEGDVRSGLKNDLQNRGSFNRPSGDTCENMNGTDGQVADGKIQQFGGVHQGMQCSQQHMHEARTIGGVQYLARKQDYIPNMQFISPETLMSSRHLQPPVIY